MIMNIVTVQILLSTLTILLSFFLFRGFLPRYVAATGALFVALCPHLVTMNAYLLTETLFCFFLVLTGWIVMKFFSNPSLSRSFITGTAVAMTALIRSEFRYIALIMGIYLILNFDKKIYRGLLLSFFLGFLICYSPWVIRNQYVNPDSSKRLMIGFIHHGIYPDFTYDKKPESYGYPYRHDPDAEKIREGVTSVLMEIKRRFTSEPVRHAAWFISKPLYLWSWSMIQGYDIYIYPLSGSPYFSEIPYRITYDFMKTLHWPMVFFGMSGCLIAWLPERKTGISEKELVFIRFVSLILIYYTAINIIGSPFPRYSIPLRPFLYGIALFPFYLSWIKYKKQSTKDNNKNGDGYSGRTLSD